MAKIHANDGIDNSGKILLEGAGHMVTTQKVEQSNLVAYINEQAIDVLLVRSATTFRKSDIDACSGLKMIGRGGVGMDNIDVAYGREKNIEVFNTPGASSQSVAELVMAHLFSMSRFLHESNRKMAIEGVDKFDVLKKGFAKGIELRGKKLGIIGFGRIGQCLAGYAIGCGMQVIAVDPFVHKANVEILINGKNIQIPIQTVDINQLLHEADFISVHVPKQANGKAVITKQEIDKMKNGVCLVNTARGGVIDENDLLAALNSGKVAHAALDVFENEPTPKLELLQHAKISLTPHIGANTIEAQDRIGVEIAEKIISFFSK